MSLDSTTSKDDKAVFELEDGSILDYPDKLVFLAKEMKMKSHNERSQYLNQYLIAHLNLDTVNNYEFVDPNEVKSAEVDEDSTPFNLEQMIQRSMNLVASVPSEKAKLKLQQKILNQDISEEEKKKRLKLL